MQYRIKELKEQLSKALIELDDTKGFLAQEKECSEALRKERTKLKREITMLKKKGGLTNGK
jgi:chromosome segregation ATPase